MKKIAIPVDGDKLHGHFGAARNFKFYFVENDKVVDTESLTPPPHTPGSIPKWIVDNKVTDVILGGVGQKAVAILEQFNIKVAKGAPVKKADTLVKEYIAGTLDTTGEDCHEHGHQHKH
jgi:predicted Fe-Mo cluster-binding NifX family protein